MKLVSRLFYLAPIIFLFSVFTARSQNRLDNERYEDVFQKIERAYLHGKISLDKKVLFKFYAGSNTDQLPAEYRSHDNPLLKCGTSAFSDFRNNKSRLSKSSVREIESLLSSPSAQATQSYQSPSGKFMIYYETSGADGVPADDSDGDGIPNYVEWTAEAADSSWNHEVAGLGYSDPVVGNSEPYKIYIEIPFFGQNTYGETHTGSYKNVGDATVIVINSELDESRFHFNTDANHTRGAIKVTVAHEFKHAIQYAANQWRGETVNWLEMDATLMEEVVYDDVNDYYSYIQSDESIFSNPEQSFYPGSYYHVSWALYFEERYGSQFWVDVWSIIKQNPHIAMVDALVQNLGSREAFNRSYIESQLWHYASGPENTSLNFGFEESSNYPAPPVRTAKDLYNANFTIPRPNPLDSPHRFAAKYYEIPVRDNVRGEIRLDAAAHDDNKGVGLIAYYNDGSVKSSMFLLSENRSAFKIPNLDWNNIDRLGLVLTNSSTSSSSSSSRIFVGVGSDDFNNTLSQNYPNPFNPSTKIRFTLEETSHVELKIYDSSGRLVKTLINKELASGFYEPTFDGTGLASGIYLYQLVTDKQNIVKKMTLVK